MVLPEMRFPNGDPVRPGPGSPRDQMGYPGPGMSNEAANQGGFRPGGPASEQRPASGPSKLGRLAQADVEAQLDAQGGEPYGGTAGTAAASPDGSRPATADYGPNDVPTGGPERTAQAGSATADSRDPGGSPPTDNKRLPVPYRPGDLANKRRGAVARTLRPSIDDPVVGSTGEVRPGALTPEGLEKYALVLARSLYPPDVTQLYVREARLAELRGQLISDETRERLERDAQLLTEEQQALDAGGRPDKRTGEIVARRGFTRPAEMERQGRNATIAVGIVAAADQLAAETIGNGAMGSFFKTVYEYTLAAGTSPAHLVGDAATMGLIGLGYWSVNRWRRGHQLQAPRRQAAANRRLINNDAAARGMIEGINKAIEAGSPNQDSNQ